MPRIFVPAALIAAAVAGLLLVAPGASATPPAGSGTESTTVVSPSPSPTPLDPPIWCC
ncbi:hypothetical protein GCM10020229_20060 [Kitasatospora albolonga]|uniref:hypothetical protein n=1 Tax=Kitasatospora albolonga TaxID=68173 RepID=UPI0031E57417